MIAKVSHGAIGYRFGCDSLGNRKTIARPDPSRPVPFITWIQVQIVKAVEDHLFDGLALTC